MGQQYRKIPKRFGDFIAQQKIFFVGTAATQGRVNVSPKGMDSLRVIGPNKVVWLNYTGSGNETAAHLIQNNRMTLMFCSFENKPLILRLYGSAKIFHPRDAQFEALLSHFDQTQGARQVFLMEVDLVQSSCGYGVPLMRFEAERNTLQSWALEKGEDGIKSYWQEKNVHSIDGFKTEILSD